MNISLKLKDQRMTVLLTCTSLFSSCLKTIESLTSDRKTLKEELEAANKKIQLLETQRKGLPESKRCNGQI